MPNAHVENGISNEYPIAMPLHVQHV